MLGKLPYTAGHDLSREAILGVEGGNGAGASAGWQSLRIWGETIISFPRFLPLGFTWEGPDEMVKNSSGLASICVGIHLAKLSLLCSDSLPLCRLSFRSPV